MAEGKAHAMTAQIARQQTRHKQSEDEDYTVKDTVRMRRRNMWMDAVCTDKMHDNKAHRVRDAVRTHDEEASR